MRFYRNLSIRTKLLSSFVLIAVIAAVVGGVGTVGMLVLSQNENTLYTEGLEASCAISGLYAVIVEQRLELRGAVINIDDAEAVNMNFENLYAREQEFDELYNDYQTAMAQSAEKDNALITRAMDIYRGQFSPLKDQMIAAYKAGDMDAATIAYRQTAAVAEQVTDVLYELMVNTNQMAADMNYNDGLMASTLMMISMIVTVVLVVLAVVLGLYNARIIATPVSHMASAAQTLAVGDVDVTLSVDSKDEIGALASAFEAMITGIREQAGILQSVSNGDFTVSIPIRSDKDVINRAIQTFVDVNGNLIQNLQTSSNQVSAGASQISQGAQGLASGSSEQAASVEELSAAVAAIKALVDDNSAKSHKALDNCDVAGNLMNDSLQLMAQMLEAMAAIDQSSKNITQIINVIEDIAFQTNILALNASVEAARAGQHGKGFAVVAEEVGNLAKKSADAAKETASLIEGSIRQVSEGNKIVERTSESLKAVGVTAADNADIISVMTKSLEIQAGAIGEINQNIEQVATVVQTNAATAQQSAAAAEQMSAQADMLNELIAHFHVEHGEETPAPKPALKRRAANARENTEYSFGKY